MSQGANLTAQRDSSLIPAGERIVVLEDARELQLHREHVVQLEARPADARGKGQITLRDLFKASPHAP